MDVATFNPPFWFGKNMKEVIILMDNCYRLINYENKSSIIIGYSLIEAKDTLKEHNKDCIFPDFIMMEE